MQAPETLLSSGGSMSKNNPEQINSAAAHEPINGATSSPGPQPVAPTIDCADAGSTQNTVSPDFPVQSGNIIEKLSSGSISPAETGPKPEKKSVSGDDLYRRSSQYQTWSFTSEELYLIKKQTNEKGRATALQLFESSRSSLEAEKPEVFAAHGDKLTSEILELISFDEEQKYLHYFGQQIVQICAHFKMPTQVKATAISFFRRFYLVNSVMEYRPRNVLYTAVFLAAKLENYFISIETFCSRIPKTKPEDILGLEFIILQALKFTLLVHHAFRPVYGFFLDFQLLLLHPAPVMYDVNVDTIGQLYDKAKKWLNDHALLSDVSFLFTPPQIALAALYDSDKRITDRYLRLKFLHEPPEGKEVGQSSVPPHVKEHFDLILKTIKRCIKIAKEETTTSKEESTKIDEKCFFALNPLKLLKRRIKALPEQP
ncbi:cyclin-like protein [Metschnikowia bicuspidata var. bicuspidata NRRL YB-4993]|uniref:Cyclin-like protein n=1 Tax=Metschnikowia bicuspidata var. bicuspidata NRRL YB-4993 TaxID=869754 RepID=A0A1A0HGE5_9ASCO|nr:cyclin-like protein [Metschnikowia bicuspidata var. bicuspidata NRRL YB-4993]OBA22952.1 cyclin-like protein [Metschnikowia bicuspidata var. bicuspidata NRRL YB-4993]